MFSSFRLVGLTLDRHISHFACLNMLQYNEVGGDGDGATM